MRICLLSGGWLALLSLPALAGSVLIADLSDSAQAGRWRLITDKVMGGLSQGRAEIAQGALRLTGEVTTANNGGFVQARLQDIRLPDGARALVIEARGDGQTYYIHLRTTGTRLPWQYYQAGFVAPAGWTRITLPLADFRPSGRIGGAAPRAEAVRSVALVAYGRDHRADVAIRRIEAD